MSYCSKPAAPAKRTLVTTRFELLASWKSLPNPLQPLATLVADRGHARILQCCLLKGAIMDKYLDRAIKEKVQTTEMLEIHYKANWRNIPNSFVELRDLVNRAIYTDADMLQWLVEHGARLESNDLRYAGLSRVSVPVMRYLVDEFGSDPLQGTCTLQVADGRSQEDLVEFLLDVGLEINAIPPQLDVREPGPYTALYEATVHHRDLGATRLLVQRDANENQPYGLYSGQSVLEAARAGNGVEVVAIHEQAAL